MLMVKKIGNFIQVSEGRGPEDKYCNNYVLTETQKQQCLRDATKCNCGTCLCCLVRRAWYDES